RSSAENVLAVFDSEVLEITEPGVDAFECLIRGRGSIDAGVAGEAAALRRFDDQSGKPLAPAAIKPLGLCIFIEQQFERMRVAAWSARGQWGRQMADGHAGHASLCLRPLAGSANDE